MWSVFVKIDPSGLPGLIIAHSAPTPSLPLHPTKCTTTLPIKCGLVTSPVELLLSHLTVPAAPLAALSSDGPDVEVTIAPTGKINGSAVAIDAAIKLAAKIDTKNNPNNRAILIVMLILSQI
jgi:hypothetical protein